VAWTRSVVNNMVVGSDCSGGGIFVGKGMVADLVE
jgi:hypothetical protein